MNTPSRVNKTSPHLDRQICRQQIRKFGKPLLLSICLVFSIDYSAYSSATKSANLAIAAGNLNDVLLRLGGEFGLEIIVSADVVRGIKTDGLYGRMTVEQALQRLLQDLHLDYRFLDADTVTLVKKQVVNLPTAPLTASSELETVHVIDQAPSRITATLDGEISDDHPENYYSRSSSSATRIDKPLKQIPQSIQTIKRSLIEDQNNITLSESLRNVSGVVPRSTLFTPVIEGTLIRGFRAEQLLDGFSQYYNPGDRESMVNLERIEVLKGGNAVFYSGGSGAPVGGAINLVSKMPTKAAFGEFGYSYGNHEFHQPYFDYNQPLNDRLLFRITGEYTDSGSFIDQLDTRRFNINPTVSLDFDAATRLVVQGKMSRWRQPDYQGLPATGTLVGNFRIPATTFIGPDNIRDSHSDSDSIVASLRHQLNSHSSLVIKGRYADSEFDQNVQTLFGSDGFVADKPALPASTWALANAQLLQRQQERSVQAYATGQFSLGPSEHNLVLGADYTALSDIGHIKADFGPLSLGVTSVDLANPLFSAPYSDPNVAVNRPEVLNTTYGGFLQWQSAWFGRFHPLFGLRIGSIEIDYRDPVTHAAAHTRTLKPLPRVGAVYDVSRQLSLFASYSEGMRGQPFMRFSATPLPELSRQFEAGLKLEFGEQLTGQIAVYQIDREQVGVTDPGGPPGSVFAGGKQRSKGIELDFAWHPSDSLGFLANYAHTEAEFLDALAGVEQGNRLAQVPTDSGRLWASYRFQQFGLRGLTAGFGVYLNADAYLSNDNRFRTSGYHSFDAAIGYEQRHFKLEASAKNLSDQQTFQPYGYFGGRVAPTGGPAVFFSATVKY